MSEEKFIPRDEWRNTKPEGGEEVTDTELGNFGASLQAVADKKGLRINKIYRDPAKLLNSPMLWRPGRSAITIEDLSQELMRLEKETF